MNLRLIKHIFIASFILGACSIENGTSAMDNPQTGPCDCDKTFEELVMKLESNYVALALTKDTEKLKKYDELKKDYSSKVKEVSASQCTKFLNDFLSFFEDGHLYAAEYPKLDSLELSRSKDFLIKQMKGFEEIAQMKNQSSATILGYWSDGESIFKIVENGTYYDAYLVKSNRENVDVGSLKARLSQTDQAYEGSYFQYNYNARYVRASVLKEASKLSMGSVTWVRTDDTTIPSNILSPTIKKLDEKNTLLTIPSFLVDYNEFQDFLKENKSLLNSTKHLIIDIRGNTGGNAIYFPLIKLFATKAYKSKQGFVITSEDNRAYFERLKGFGSSKVYTPVLNRMTKNGEVVDGPDYPERSFKRGKADIERVSILMDNGSASASESFVLHAKGSSDLVTTFGSPSRGMIDFTSVNSILLKNSGSQNIYFGYPTGTLNKDVMEKGFNKTGIIPDVPIQDDTEKIQFVVDYNE
ncbi:S41 family peptidase [Ekhidna sp.]